MAATVLVNPVNAVLDEIEEAYLRRDLKTDAFKKMQGRKSRNVYEFRVFERTLDDVDIGDGSGSCLRTDGGYFKKLPGYILDSGTLMFHLSRNGRPLGYVRVFAGMLGKSHPVPAAYIDMISIHGQGDYNNPEDYKGSKFEREYSVIDAFAISAVIEHVKRAGFEQVAFPIMYLHGKEPGYPYLRASYTLTLDKFGSKHVEQISTYENKTVIDLKDSSD